MDHSRRLRKEQTDAESGIWSRLRNHQLGVKFRRQHRACGFILDFACAEKMLAVELDGGQHGDDEITRHDEQRTAVLESAGWRVLRFWNNDALTQTNVVLDAIWNALQDSPPHPNSLPRKRGRGSSAPTRAAQELDRGNDDWRPSADIEAIRLRARLYALIRDFFAERNVLEVETPVLSQAGNTDPNIASFSLEFSGRTDGAPRTRWLRTSPEYPLKRLLAAGVGDCYELGRVFRDGEAGGRHNPEFTMLEWYRVGWDHHRLIDEAAGLVAAALALVGREAAVEKIAYRDLYLSRLGVDPAGADTAQLIAALGDVEIDPAGLGRDDWLDLLMTHRLQPEFPADRLTVVYDYPASQCALARIRDGEFAVAERFELYLGPLELANGYHELKDADEQRRRFLRDLETRAGRGSPQPPIDERLLQALASGLPDCAGVALGVDRLLMAMLGVDRIGDALSFAFARA